MCPFEDFIRKILAPLYFLGRHSFLLPTVRLPGPSPLFFFIYSRKREKRRYIIHNHTYPSKKSNFTNQTKFCSSFLFFQAGKPQNFPLFLFFTPFGLFS